MKDILKPTETKKYILDLKKANIKPADVKKQEVLKINNEETPILPESSVVLTSNKKLISFKFIALVICFFISIILMFAIYFIFFKDKDVKIDNPIKDEKVDKDLDEFEKNIKDIENSNNSTEVESIENDPPTIDFNVNL